MTKEAPIRPDTALIERLMRMGASDLKKCMQCATCTSACKLSTDEYPFPRKQVLAAQWGLKDELLEDPSPWLCFYCGQCSKTCTRGAKPGEIMMALRRYLTSEYDWTGLSRFLYRSAVGEIGVLLLVALLVVGLFTVPASFGFRLLSQSGPAPLANVMLDKFAPKHVVHIADMLLAVLLGALLLVNAGRMFKRLTARHPIPARFYFRHAAGLLVQGVTQIRWKGCQDGDAMRNWIRHLALVTGYGTIFTLVVVFLPWFQVENSGVHWTAILGYYATAILLATTAWMLFDRITKRTEMHRFSHLSDWMFPVLLFLTAASGILVHILRRMDRPMPTYEMYMVHLAIAVPMLVVEVPFGKWAHLLYRPLAIFIAEAREDAKRCGV